MKTHPLPTYLQRFFTERLATQMKASPHTVTSYRDTFRLLLICGRPAPAVANGAAGGRHRC